VSSGRSISVSRDSVSSVVAESQRGENQKSGDTPWRAVARPETKPPEAKPTTPGKGVEMNARLMRKSALRVDVSKLRVTEKKLERSGISSSPVRNARTGDARSVRDKSTPPDRKGLDAERRKAQPSKSDLRDRAKDAKGKVEPVRSDPRDARNMCKSRPSDNRPKDKPKGGGGGGGRKFVPWKGTKYGC